jgi:predicted dehydrogenase
MGRGALYWTHPHSVDLILYLAGERRVEALQARLANVVRGDSSLAISSDPVVESASIYFEGGLAGQITQAAGSDLVLSCSEGEITVESDGRGICIAMPRGEDPYLSRTAYEGLAGTPVEEGTLAPVSQLAGCLSGDPEQILINASSKAHMLEGQRILFAMVQSHLENSRLVKFADIDPAMSIQAKTGENFA